MVPFEKGRLFPLTQGGPRDRALHQALHADASLAPAVRAGLLLYAGYWDEAHTVAQDLHTPEGSYWHAILHRLEPDAWNAGYWFRRVGAHPVFPQVHAAALALGYPHAGRAWDPLRFIEFCEQAARQPGSPNEQMARQLQYAEWEALLRWCLEITNTPAAP